MVTPESILTLSRRAVVAPAGHGKTELIAKVAALGRRTLVLTHTHAGVHAIRARLQRMHVPSDKVVVDTIASWARQYVHILNDLFKTYGIQVKENFVRTPLEGSTVLEQIDGVIDFGGGIHLVEMKWLKDPVGVQDLAPHLVRVVGRADASGIFISSSGFTQPAITQFAEVLNQKTMLLCSMEEIVMLLQRQGDLVDLWKRKSQAATLSKQPLLKILN